MLHEIGHIILDHSEDSNLAEDEVKFFAKYALVPPTEKEPPASLSDFVSSLSATRYFISNDGSIVYAYNNEKQCVTFCYRSEELMIESPSE